MSKEIDSEEVYEDDTPEFSRNTILPIGNLLRYFFYILPHIK